VVFSNDELGSLANKICLLAYKGDMRDDEHRDLESGFQYVGEASDVRIRTIRWPWAVFNLAAASLDRRTITAMRVLPVPVSIARMAFSRRARPASSS
jgi:hypothetical protein